ncbi:MAG: amidohydrolase [Candidatus Poribacteria bacterium]|nr:MAG: amidohydrolase [Candidatus Poribacteria bacterium]
MSWLLQNGTVYGTEHGPGARLDLRVEGGRVVAIASRLSPLPEDRALDLDGRIVTPGWIDLHAHVYWGVTTWGIPADPICLSTGVTTVVDAGSAGWATFPGFCRWIVQGAKTRVLAFVHISGIGLTYGPVGEMEDLRYADPELTAEAIRLYPETAVGVKVRQGAAQVGSNGVRPLERAVEAAELAGVPVMVHIGAGVPLPEVLRRLRPGDIVTHCYQGRGDTILNERGELLPEVRQARASGVWFDVGHGSGSFRLETARRAIEQGCLPDVISSDLHAVSVEGPVFDMPTTASKFLSLGMRLEDVIRAVTETPAQILNRPELGRITVGGPADLAVFELIEGEFRFEDTHQQGWHGGRLLRPVYTLRNGELWTPERVWEEFGHPWEQTPPMARKANRQLMERSGIRPSPWWREWLLKQTGSAPEEDEAR